MLVKRTRVPGDKREQKISETAPDAKAKPSGYAVRCAPVVGCRRRNLMLLLSHQYGRIAMSKHQVPCRRTGSLPELDAVG